MTFFGDSHFQRDTQAKEILSFYSFSGLNALAMQRWLSQPQSHGLYLALLIQVFGFTPGDSAAKAQAVISAAPDPTSHLYAIIHRGLDGFLHWQKNQDDGVAKDFAEIIAHFQKSRS